MKILGLEGRVYMVLPLDITISTFSVRLYRKEDYEETIATNYPKLSVKTTFFL